MARRVKVFRVAQSRTHHQLADAIPLQRNTLIHKKLISREVTAQPVNASDIVVSQGHVLGIRTIVIDGKSRSVSTNDDAILRTLNPVSQ